eukprot:CAMPEP_0174696616 /NCGR_PEP_ID=MMETSP1094-20130205/2720_1 /TAXON_ID=156173 /ORGANISM="Chrysochromulina brevifilum, Strain UTEX LB 985" /LENGTH=87 /DNA_ID=CAMNT_0015893433 /DNA_START=1 /DNA_END=264 /DNA_ORIENTATION=-
MREAEARLETKKEELLADWRTRRMTIPEAPPRPTDEEVLSMQLPAAESGLLPHRPASADVASAADSASQAKSAKPAAAPAKPGARKK